MESLKKHRFESNPTEKLFFDEFVVHCMYGRNVVDNIVYGSDGQGFPNQYLTDNEINVVANTIQWLGSPVGKNFLEKCGFVEKEKS